MRQISYRAYRNILAKNSKFNNGTGGGDNSVDPSPTRNPNGYLAPIAGNSSMITGVFLVVGYLLIVYLVVVIAKQFGHKINY
jgi:hypothetical protein